MDIPNPLIEQRDEWEPFIADRVTDFWSTGRLDLRMQKIVQYSMTPTTDPADQDVTQRMTTTVAVVKIMQISETLGDSELQDAAHQRLRHHIMSRQFGHREILDVIHKLYESGISGDYVGKLKSVLLSALVRNSAAICSGPHQTEFATGLAKYPDLWAQYVMGTAYMNHICTKDE